MPIFCDIRFTCGGGPLRRRPRRWQMLVDRDRGVVAVRDRPDDVLRAERRVAAEEHARAASTAIVVLSTTGMPHSSNVDARCRARSTETRSPGRPRPARRRRESARRARRSARSWRRPLRVVLRRDLLEHHAGQLAVVVRERLGHEVVVDRDALVHRVFLLPRRRLHLVEAGAHDDLHVLAAEAPRRCGSSPSRCCRRPARSTRLPICVDVAERHATTASRCRCGCSPRLRSRPGNVEVAAARRAAADEHRVVAFRRAAPSCCRCAGRRGTRCRGRGRSRPPRRSRDSGRRNFGICVRIMPPACGVAVEHDAFVAERREIARDGQRRRARRRRSAMRLPFFVVARLAAGGRGCLPCSRRRRASGGRSRPARAWPWRSRCSGEPSSTRPRRHAGSHGRSQVRPRMPGKDVRLPVDQYASP